MPTTATASHLRMPPHTADTQLLHCTLAVLRAEQRIVRSATARGDHLLASEARTRAAAARERIRSSVAYIREDWIDARSHLDRSTGLIIAANMLARAAGRPARHGVLS